MLFTTLFDNIRRCLIPLYHEDMTPIIRSYAEEIMKKSRKGENPDCFGAHARRTSNNDTTNNASSSKIDVKTKNTSKSQEDNMNDNTLLYDATEEQLLLELAKRKADKYRLFGSMKKKKTDGDDNNEDE